MTIVHSPPALRLSAAPLLFCHGHLREIGELRKELDRQREEAAKAKKALEDKIAEELVLKGELDADEVRHVQLNAAATYLAGTHAREAWKHNICKTSGVIEEGV